MTFLLEILLAFLNSLSYSSHKNLLYSLDFYVSNVFAYNQNPNSGLSIALSINSSSLKRSIDSPLLKGKSSIKPLF